MDYKKYSTNHFLSWEPFYNLYSKHPSNAGQRSSPRCDNPGEYHTHSLDVHHSDSDRQDQFQYSHHSDSDRQDQF